MSTKKWDRILNESHLVRKKVNLDVKSGGCLKA